LIKLTPPKDPQKKPSDFLSKIFTKLEVLEQSPSEELKPVSLNPIWNVTLPLLIKPLWSNLLKCITNNSPKLFQETMLVSILKTLPSKNLKEEMLPLTLKETHLEKLLLSWLKSSFLITPEPSKMDIPPS
jgi:hypothetical protein